MRVDINMVQSRQENARAWVVKLARYREPSTWRSVFELAVTLVPFVLLWALAWAALTWRKQAWTALAWTPPASREAWRPWPVPPASQRRLAAWWKPPEAWPLEAFLRTGASLQRPLPSAARQPF